MIRKGEPTDFPALMEMGERLKQQTPYAGIKIDREQAMKVYGYCMSSALGCAWVAEQDGEVTGFLFGTVDKLWWSKSRFASDLIFYCEDGRSGLPLLRKFIDWAWSTPNVFEISCAQSSGMKRIGVLYRRCGFENEGGIWTLRKNEPT